MRFAVLLVLAGLLLHVAEAHETARATYVGNEGVLVARGQTKVLFDAFYSDSYGKYLTVPAGIRDAMMRSEAPYDGVDVVLVSHIHGDHFSPAPMIAYLRAQPQVCLYAPRQVVEALARAGLPAGDPVIARIVAVDLSPDDEARTFSIAGLEIDVVALPHDGDLPEIQNYSWRVTLDDATTVIHFGDAGAVIEHFERHKEHFDAREHAAAFPPFWWYLQDLGRAVLETYVKADQTIGIHVPASSVGKGDEMRSEFGGDIFTDPGETRDIGSHARAR